MASKAVFAFMLGMQLFHGEAGDPVLAHMPKPAEPYAADWERAEGGELSLTLEARIVSTSPIVTGGLDLTGWSGVTAGLRVVDQSFVQVFDQRTGTWR